MFKMLGSDRKDISIIFYLGHWKLMSPFCGMYAVALDISAPN